MACKTPNYVEKEPVAKVPVKIPFASDVTYTISDNFQDETINCIAVPKFSISHQDKGYSNIDQANVIRKSVYGVLSAKNYRSVDLSRIDFKSRELGRSSDELLLHNLDCDALLNGKVLSFKNHYFLAYSVTTVELQLTLVNRSGSVLWTARHAASSHEGAMPLSPLSLLSGIFTATTNKQDEVAFQMVDAVSRRLLNTLPDGVGQNPFDDAIGTIIDEKFVDKSLVSSSQELVEDQFTSDQLLAKGAYEEAISQAKKEIEADKSNGQAYRVAATASLLLFDASAAIDFSLSAIAYGEQNSETYLGLGVAYLKNENVRLARASFLKSAELAPSSFEAQFNLALVSEVEGQVSNAAGHYFQAGNLALETKQLSRIHKALTALKRLSSKNSVAENLYLKLGQSVQSTLNG